MNISDHFRPPTLHLLIVDDDQDDWSPRLKTSFEEYLDNWALYRRNFFSYELHLCRSENSFKKKALKLLEAGALIYAAVDLILPRYDHVETPDRNLWKDLVRWCFDKKIASAQGRHQFDFCVMSGEDSALSELYSDAEHGEKLRNQGIKRISKSEVDQSPVPEHQLAPLWEDVRNFIRSHVICCEIPDRGAEQGWSTMVWFGSDPKLSELRYQADRIATRREGGLHLLFSDATAYEDSWFRLVCHLRGIEEWKILSLVNVNTSHDPHWDRDFHQPPEALLITHVGRAVEQGCRFDQIFKQSDFFDKIKAARSQVFVQFPYVTGEQNIALTLDSEEVRFLDICLKRVNAPTFEELDAGFAYSKNPRILHFPSFNELKSIGVIRKIIEFEAGQCQDRLDLPNRALDPEVMAVLAENPWHEKQYGLYELQRSIRRAYREAAEHPQDLGRYVGEDQFTSQSVAGILHSREGFSLRVHQLFNRLARRESTSVTRDPAVQRLQGLEEVHDLYDRLKRLELLYEELKESGIINDKNDPLGVEFQPLNRALEFLDLVFGSPEDLLERIVRFRRVVKSPAPALKNHVEDFSPSLRERPNWRELVDQMRFVWPYDTFPLPAPVSEYIRHSNVVAEFHPDFPTILRRYPQLAAEWEKLESQRKKMRELLQDRENQRWAADCYVRDHDSHPVCVPLAGELEKRRDPSRAFECAFRSLILFNAHLACCENLYRFNNKFLEPSDIMIHLKRPDLKGDFILTNKYASHLRKAGHLESSVFSRWKNTWLDLGQQRDAVRMVRKIAEWLRSDGSLREKDEKGAISRLSELEDNKCCTIDAVLDMLCIIRNAYCKIPNDRIWPKEGEVIWDLLRRFVVATTRPDLRLGWMLKEGSEPLFWSREGPMHSDGALARVSPGWPVCVFLSSHESPAFPIGDLVRIDPEDWSVWGAYSAGEDWFNLTYQGEGDSRRAPGNDHPWLPSREEFLDFDIWRCANGQKG